MIESNNFSLRKKFRQNNRNMIFKKSSEKIVNLV